MSPLRFFDSFPACLCRRFSSVEYVTTLEHSVHALLGFGTIGETSRHVRLPVRRVEIAAEIKEIMEIVVITIGVMCLETLTIAKDPPWFSRTSQKRPILTSLSLVNLFRFPKRYFLEIRARNEPRDATLKFLTMLFSVQG